MPGDSDEHEWIGYIPFEELPKVLNPPGGVIATANARVVGPRYRRYLTDRWYSPYRTDSIYRQLERRAGLRPEQCITIQADTVSPPHAMLAKMLVEASKKVAPKDARVQRLLERLPQWDGRADASSRHMAFVEFTRRELMRAILRTHLGDDWARYQWSRSSVFFENVMTERPARWLPKEYTSYDEFLVASADRAVQELERQVRQLGVARPDDPEQWRWGQFVQLEFLHPLGRAGFLRRHLSMADVDQSGASTSIKQTGRSVGAAMRFVADLSNLDNSLMNITLGQSGHYLSKHYKDQFPAWYAGRGIPSAFSDAAEEKVRRHRLVMSAAR
jgi:penicillin amidase